MFNQCYNGFNSCHCDGMYQNDFYNQCQNEYYKQCDTYQVEDIPNYQNLHTHYVNYQIKRIVDIPVYSASCENRVIYQMAGMNQCGCNQAHFNPYFQANMPLNNQGQFYQGNMPLNNQVNNPMGSWFEPFPTK